MNIHLKNNLFGPLSPKQRWMERGIQLFQMVDNLEQYQDSEALLVLLRSALEVCERRVAGIENLEAINDKELIARAEELLKEAKQWRNTDEHGN